MRKVLCSKSTGFTVLELLIVLAVIFAFALAFVFFFNPGEFLKEKRDEKRIEDLKDLQSLFDKYIESGTGTVALGSANVVFISWPGEVRDKNGELISVQYDSSDPAQLNSLGWIPINFLDMEIEPVIPQLPRDPRSNGEFVYTFSNDGEGKYQISAKLESQKYVHEMTEDCGDNPGRYEVGSNCELLP